MQKKALFVTYGGGHAHMITPVIQALHLHPHIQCEALALTLGAAAFKKQGLPYKGFKDFLRAPDVQARQWGEALAASHHQPESGIEYEESVAYLGLSYWDLVQRHGEQQAAQLWAEEGRHAFLPLTVMERVLDEIKPDIVVTTNSPKSEQAAVQVANARGIPTLSMSDLFGIHHFHPLESNYITVLSERTIDNMAAEGVTLPRERHFITGNPAFDQAFDYRGATDYVWRKKHFPHVPDNAKTLLWIDMPAYWNLKARALHTRSNEEIIADLDTLAAATKAHGEHLLIRPHPSQSRVLYDNWMQEKQHRHVHFAGDVPLYPLLKATDVVATYTSTVSVEALLMEKRVIQLKYQPGRSDMPLGEWDMAWMAESPQELIKCVGDAFYDDKTAIRMQENAKKILPQEKAAPKVAAHIERIIGVDTSGNIPGLHKHQAQAEVAQ